MNIKEYLDVDQLKAAINVGYIGVNKHPESDLYILCYTKLCTIDRAWNDVTEKCRGLIVDSEGTIISRPFKKFYNYEQIEDKSLIPNLPFEVFEKMDGSLGILYWEDNAPWIATKGSFTSDQAKIANRILWNRYFQTFDHLNKGYTYLFEIISPEDAHVVNYGNDEDLYLLAVINTEIGKEYNIDDFSHLFKSTHRYYNVKDWTKLRELIDGTNREGFVIKFSNNFRVKLKYTEYFEIHYILYGLSDNEIFDIVREGKDDDLTILKDKLPEAQWLRIDNLVQTFKGMYLEVAIKAQTEFRNDFEDRSQAAMYYKTCTYPSVMFAMLDGKDISQFIWKIVAKQRKNDK